MILNNSRCSCPQSASPKSGAALASAAVQGPNLALFPAALTVSLALLPSAANAHVKWFVPFDLAAAPRALGEVCSGPLGWLVAVSVLVLWAVCRVEQTVTGNQMLRSLDLLGNGLRSRTDDLIRAGVGAFFVALCAMGGVILTPELKTDAPAIPILQACIAAAMFWRGTLPFSAAGIAILFAYAVARYGSFHMMDYPIFLGLAGYFGLTGLQCTGLRIRPIDLARWGTAVTLMWASVEKWAYPGWTFPLLEAHPHVGFGLNPEFVLCASGVVEFGLAFGLLWTPLVRRLSAIVLGAMFTAAIPEFGKLDAIGHLPIIVVLLAVFLDDATNFRRPAGIGLVACYSAAVAGFIAVYYGAHALLIGTPGA